MKTNEFRHIGKNDSCAGKESDFVVLATETCRSSDIQLYSLSSWSLSELCVGRKLSACFLMPALQKAILNEGCDEIIGTMVSLQFFFPCEN